MNNSIYKKLIQQCTEIIDEKLEQIETSLHTSEEALFADTKSSAGDKYETSREMIQQDLDRLQKQLIEIRRDRKVLRSVPDEPSAAAGQQKHIRQGSVVVANQGTYFLAVGLGKITVDGQSIFAISMKSPVGQAMLGKTVGDSFAFRGSTFLIKEVYSF